MADINLDQLRTALNEMVTNMNTASEAARDLAASEKAAADAEAEHAAKQKALWDQTKKGFSDLHGSLTSTSGGMSKYSSSINAFGGAISSVAKEMGPLGKAIGYTIDGLVKMTDMVMKQNDAIMGSFKGMKDFGATMSLSTNQILELGKQAGFTSHNLESFYKSTKNVGAGLVTLGATTSEGIKNFSELAATTKQQRDAFRNLGYSQEEFTEMQSTYVKQLALTGGTLAKTPKQLGEESRKYVEQLTLLAELTGKNVKEQQKGLDLALANENFNAYQASLERDRIKALEDGNKAEADRLEKQIKAGQAVASWATTTLDAQKATGVLESISNKTGAIITANNASWSMTGVNIQELSDAIKEGKSVEEAVMKARELNYRSIENYTGMMKDNTFQLGKTSKEMNSIFGYSKESNADALAYRKLMKMSVEEREKFLAGEREKLEKTKETDDSLLKLNAAREETELEYRKAMDEFTKLISGPVNGVLRGLFEVGTVLIKVFRFLIDIIDGVTTNIGKIGSTIGGWFGGGSKTPTTPSKGATGGVSAPVAPTTSAGGGGGGGTAPAVAPPVSKPAAGSAPAGGGTKSFQTDKPGSASRDNPIVSVLDVGPGFNVVQRPDGKKEKLEGARNWRNNNPGNIEFGAFSKQFGAIAGDPRFAIFPSYDAGRSAKAALIFTGKNYANLDLQSAIYRYAPPSENNSAQYFQSVLSSVNGQNKKMSEYTSSERESILSAMERMEGFRQGKVTTISARAGGIASGPESGYPATLHRTEGIIPLEPGSLITRLMKTPETVIAKEMGVSNITNNSSTSSSLNDVVTVLTEKLDSVIYALAASNSTQEQILKYSRN